MRFCHLHTHSHYSLLEAVPKVPDLVARAKEAGQTHLALTDLNNLYAVIEFYKECKGAGIVPIIGVDLAVAPRTRHDKEHGIDDKTDRIVLLAENITGYQNLVKLVSRSQIEGFLYTARADDELLTEYAEGVVAIIPTYTSSLDGDIVETKHAYVTRIHTIFKNKTYIEYAYHPNTYGNSARLESLERLSATTGVPLVASREVYYLDDADRVVKDLVVHIQKNTSLTQEDEDRSADYSFWAPTEDEVARAFAHARGAVENMQNIANLCTVTLDLGKWVFPNFPLLPGKTYDEMLREFTYAEAPLRGVDLHAAGNEKLKERVDYELSVIQKKGYSPYFLVVADLMRYAREANVYTNTRGSAAGSFVSYLTGITTVNPVEYNLPFERFLNPERPSAPDIDMDVADNKRDALIDYARSKYGDAHVAQIGTFGTMAARAAVRDVSRALGYSYSVGDRIAKLIPVGAQGFQVTIKKALESEKELAELYKKDPVVRQVLNYAERIEGNARHVGVHAAGVVMSPTPVTDFTPIQLDPKGGKTITQYDMYSVEEAGLLKFDFLGLKNLAVLADSVARVKKIQNIDVPIYTLPLDNARTFKMLSRGRTMGVFQFASDGMTRYLTELEPTSVYDLNAMVALYRPGPMEFIPEYIARKKDASRVSFLDPRLQPILEKSYGIITYQDDVLMIAINIAGYSWLDADKFRKAMGKKIPEEMAAQKEKFMNGCRASGTKEAVVQELWKQIETFAAYGFNKCLPKDVRIYNVSTGIPTTIKHLLNEQRAPHVSALNEHTQRLVSAPSSVPISNGVKNVFLLKTRSGKHIRATDNHPFLTWGGWRQLGDIRPGERLALPRALPSPKKHTKLASHEARILGMLISEGNLCHPHGIYFYSTQEDECNAFIAAARSFKNTSITIDTTKKTTSIYVGQKNTKLGNTLREWLDAQGLLDKKATEKFVPDVVFGASQGRVAEFLAALWQGDGCVSVANGQIYYATSSRQLADDVSHLLLRFGIISTTHTKKFAYRGTHKIGYTVVISGAECLTIFTKHIEIHLLSKKKRDLRDLCTLSTRRTNTRGRGTRDTVPADVLLLVRSEMSRVGITANGLAKRVGIAPRLLFTDTRKKGFTRDILARIAKALHSTALMTHATSDIFWDEVVSIEADGKEETFDIAVDTHHNFVANDIYVHNSHAASYGNLAYKTAYMKANYPCEYMAALMTADSGDVETIAEMVKECEKMKLLVLPPNINESFGVFSVDLNTKIRHVMKDEHGNELGGITEEELAPPNRRNIRFGLTSIKNFGEGLAEAIVAERKAHGPFKDLADFLSRVGDRNLNKKSLESLIKSGSLDRFANRSTLLHNLEALLAFHREVHKDAAQDSLFGSFGAAKLELVEPKEHISKTQLLAWEKELLGLYVSGHPLDAHKEKLAGKADIHQMLTIMPVGVTNVIGVHIDEVRTLLTKKGDKMAFVKVSDFSGNAEVVFFPEVFAASKDFLVGGNTILIKGKVSNRNGEKSIMADAAKRL